MDELPDNKPEEVEPEKKTRGPRRVGYRKQIAKNKQRIKVYLGKEKNGRRKYRTETVIGGAADAEKRIIEIIRRNKAGEPLKPSIDTFSIAIDSWLEAVKHSVSEGSLKIYDQIVRLYIKPALGGKMIAQIKRADVQKFYNDLSERKREKGEGTLSAATVKYIHVVLGMIFKQAVEDALITGSPLVGVKLPKMAKSIKKQKVLTPEQIQRFIEAAKDTRFENLFVMAFRLGCRPTELLGLRWQDVKLQERTLTVNHNLKWRKAKDWYLKEPKTAASQRTLPITDTVIEAIEREREKQNEVKLLKARTYTDRGFIFADNDGEPFNQWHVRWDCKLILKKAGLPLELSPYSARHSMATLLLTAGVDVRSVSERLGHTKPATTLNFYAHALPGRQEAVSEEMDRILEVKE
jgi:integrase